MNIWIFLVCEWMDVESLCLRTGDFRLSVSLCTWLSLFFGTWYLRSLDRCTAHDQEITGISKILCTHRTRTYHRVWDRSCHMFFYIHCLFISSCHREEQFSCADIMRSSFGGYVCSPNQASSTTVLFYHERQPLTCWHQAKMSPLGTRC